MFLTMLKNCNTQHNYKYWKNLGTQLNKGPPEISHTALLTNYQTPEQLATSNLCH